MKLPFGLDLKTVIVTLLFVFFVLPMITGFIAQRRNGNGNNS